MLFFVLYSNFCFCYLTVSFLVIVGLISDGSLWLVKPSKLQSAVKVYGKTGLVQTSVSSTVQLRSKKKKKNQKRFEEKNKKVNNL